MSCPTGRCRKFGPCAWCLGLLPAPKEADAPTDPRDNERETRGYKVLAAPLAGLILGFAISAFLSWGTGGAETQIVRDGIASGLLCAAFWAWRDFMGRKGSS